MNENYKAITSIPGWSEILNEALRGTAQDGVELYKKSVWAKKCIDVKANALAGIEWGFFDVNGEEVERDNLARVLLEGSQEENLNDILRGTMSDLDIFGHAFWEKQGSESTLTGINRINAGTMQPKINKSTGEIVGFQQKVGTKTQDFQREEVVYFHNYNPDNDLIGLSPLKTGRYAILTEIKANEYLAAFFANGAIPAAILTTEQILNDQDVSRLQRWYNRTFKGVKNQHKVGFFDKGMKLNRVGMTNSELALKEIREEARRDICALLGVPPVIAGAWEAANYATSREQRMGFYTETIFPVAQYMAGVINAELIAQVDQSISLGWKFKELDVMQPDMAAERESIASLVTAGVITPLAAAVQLGYEEKDAGIGPVTTRIVDDTPEEPINKTHLQMDLEKWQRKAENNLSKGKAAQVQFESTAIPPLVNEVIYDKLGKADTKKAVAKIFGGFY